jgi:hypothetical protein
LVAGDGVAPGRRGICDFKAKKPKGKRHETP